MTLTKALVVWLLIVTPLAGCARPGGYVHSSYDFSNVKRVAVLPLENHTQDQTAAEKVRKAVVGEILITRVVDVIELGQVNRALTAQGVQSIAALGTEEIRKLGTAIGVQALVLGSVDVYERVNVGGVPFAEIAVSLRAIDAATGTIVWSATGTAGGVGVVGRLFGVGGETMTEATRKAVRSAIVTLFQ
jgi:hypothetical protein